MNIDKLLTLLKSETDECEIFLHETQDLSVSMEQGKPKMSSTNRDAGLAVRVQKNGKLGFAVSTLPSDYREIVKAAVEVAEVGKACTFSFAEPPEKDYPDAPGLDTEPAELEVTEQTVDEAMAIIRKASQLIEKYDPKVNGSASVAREKHRIRIVNSRGVDIDFAKTVHSFGTSASITEDHSTFHWARGYTRTRPGFDPEAMAQNLIEEFSAARTVASIESKKMPVVFDPCALADVLCCFTTGITGTNVARGISPLVGRRGEKIFSDKLTITDDPFYPDAIDTAPADDEGTPCKKTVLVENGVLKNYLTDLKSASDLKELPSTGNGLRNKSIFGWKDYAVVPHVRATNLIIRGGDVHYGDLISNIDEGLLIYTLPDVWQGNIINGAFTGSVFFGMLIKGGKPAGRVKGVQITGNIYDLFKDQLVALSRETDFANMHQNTIAPHALFKDVNVLTA